MATGLHSVAPKFDIGKVSAGRSELIPADNPIVRGVELWHLLSLDAPSVAMLWTWFLAKANHIFLPLNSVLAMGIAVWMLYAADRLLDARAVGPMAATTSAPTSSSDELQPRHYFHLGHQKGFRIGILVASFALALLLPTLAADSIRLYLVLGTLLFGYFVLIHLNSANTPRLPKELAVGVFFSAATFIPTVARKPGLRLELLPGALLFAVACSLNCLFIHAWEHDAVSPQAPIVIRIALRFRTQLAVSAAIAGCVMLVADRPLPWPISASCASAIFLLLLVHQVRRRLSPTTLRAAADLCLLAPLLLLPLLHD